MCVDPRSCRVRHRPRRRPARDVAQLAAITLSLSRGRARLDHNRSRVARACVMTAPNVVYVTADKMGGVININGSLMQRRAGGAMPKHVVLTRNALDHEARFPGTFAAES